MSSIKDGVFAGLKAGLLYSIVASIINVIIIYILIGEFALAYGYSQAVCSRYYKKYQPV